MNSIMTNHYPIFEHYQAIRNQIMEALTDTDFAFHPGGENRMLGEFTVKPFVQLEIYKEALLIFYGKVSVYFHAMNRPLPQQMQEWIG